MNCAWLKSSLGRPNEVRGFTLVEVLAIIAILSIVAATLLPALCATNDRSSRSQCANNLREVGVACNIYAAENNDFVPQRSWPLYQYFWQASEACRVAPGTTNITRGLYNLGLLWTAKSVPNAAVFYCPSRAKSVNGSYAYYATAPNTWPSTPVGSMDDNVRTGYSYYPQPKDTEVVSGYVVPTLSYGSYIDSVGNKLTEPAPLKTTQIDLKKAGATDSLQDLQTVAHRDGFNALFPDAHVKFQSRLGNPQAFDPYLWGDISSSDTAPSSLGFRRVMALWQP
jgi:type II secretory pathway pseudopilin PulG